MKTDSFFIKNDNCFSIQMNSPPRAFRPIVCPPIVRNRSLYSPIPRPSAFPQAPKKISRKKRLAAAARNLARLSSSMATALEMLAGVAVKAEDERRIARRNLRILSPPSMGGGPIIE